MKIKLPKNWNQVTIGQFQAINSLAKKDKYTANMMTLCILSGRSMDDIEAMPRGEVLRYIDTLKWMEVMPNTVYNAPFTKGNHVYYFVLSPDEMTGGDYTDVSHFSGDPVDNLHHICAKMTTNYTIFPRKRITGDFKLRAEIFKQSMSFGMAYGYMLFFSASYPQLQKVSHSFFQGIEEAVRDFQTRSSGSASLTTSPKTD